jgi:hypothetical protein
MAIVESAEDPIPSSVRTTPVLDADQLVREERHVGLRNLHVVDAPTAASVIASVEGINVPNPRRNHRGGPGGGRDEFELQFTGGTIGKELKLYLLVPRSVDVDTTFNFRPLPELPPPVFADARRRGPVPGRRPEDWTGYKAYQAIGAVASLRGLRVPVDSTVTVGVAYETRRLTEALRFTGIAKQRGRIVGGNTWVLRPSPAAVRARR